MQPLTLTANNSSQAAASLSSARSASRQEAVEHPGIADKNVEPAKSCDGLGDRPLVVVEPADVAADRNHLVAEPRPQFVAAAGSAVHDRDPRPLLDIALDDGAADPRAAARYQRDLSVEPAHKLPSWFAAFVRPLRKPLLQHIIAVPAKAGIQGGWRHEDDPGPPLSRG